MSQTYISRLIPAHEILNPEGLTRLQAKYVFCIAGDILGFLFLSGSSLDSSHERRKAPTRPQCHELQCLSFTSTIPV
jgi:hypothetical protein